ncbi:MAG: VOC family protein [Bacteroidia bacterium]
MQSTLKLNQIHHVSIICSDIERSKKFYTDILGLHIMQEIYRSDKDSYKLDFSLNGHFILEMFTFPNSPKRTTQPEACGLRHLAFEVSDIELAVSTLKESGVKTEEIKLDEHTGKHYVFFKDPDELPIELYQK